MKVFLGRSKGFTVVELLIVIVVLAILAAVTVVAYNGLTNRAQNLHYQTRARQVIEAMEVYKSLSGSYPQGANDYVCLGSAYNANTQFDTTSQCLKAVGWGVTVDTALTANVTNKTGIAIPSTDAPILKHNHGDGTSDVYRDVLYLSRNGGHGLTYPVVSNDSKDCIQGDSFFTQNGFIACRHTFDGDPYSGL